jgi:hypothetical protein
MTTPKRKRGMVTVYAFLYRDGHGLCAATYSSSRKAGRSRRQIEDIWDCQCGPITKIKLPAPAGKGGGT